MKYIRRFSELGIDDVSLVGGKNAALGEMYNSLAEHGIMVPNGYATTAEAYYFYLQYNELDQRIKETLDVLDSRNLDSLRNAGKTLRGWIMNSEMPALLHEEIEQAYQELANQFSPNPDVAVRSSAIAKDSPTASFAGQQESYLNISGIHNLLTACKHVFASLFTDRAIAYRIDQGFPHTDVALSIGVQKMVRADLGASGTMVTLDSETGFRNVIYINACYGLGENVVQGPVNPDEFYVFKPTLEKGHRAVIKRHRGDKETKMVYSNDDAPGISTRSVQVSNDQRLQFALNDNEVLALARQGMAIERHFSLQAKRIMPMDIEWAKDGETGQLYILQARPEAVQSTSDESVQEVFKLQSQDKQLAIGTSVGQRIATGKARVILEAANMKELERGEILVCDITDPDWEPVMKIAAGIVTNRGGRTGHAAIVARELGIPAVVGTSDGTQQITTGQEITVSCAQGDPGYIYEGIQKFSVERVDLSSLPNPKTHIMLILGNPDQAFELSRLPCDGVGLIRLEFMINNNIKVHPRALIEYETLDPALKQQIDLITAGYTDPKTFYVNRLAEGIGTIAAAFYPRPVIVRFSDFKSNEYASLLGGHAFEPTEENPMIGFRGAARYFSDEFTQCFAMECLALRQVRQDMGLDNVAVMLPFVRSVEEGTRVLDLMAEYGLQRGQMGLNIFLMCEVPANALLADQFLEYFDGFSIGSNDLTQLTLGVDMGSGIVTGFDERNPAVLKLMKLAIDACRKRGKYVGICGQAPSDYPEITRWLVRNGVKSISLNADSFLATIKTVLKAEQQLRE